MVRTKPILTTLLGCSILVAWVCVPKELFSLAALRQVAQQASAFQHNSPGLSLFAYFFLYIFICALSLPGAAALTIVGGALFGMAKTTVVVSFASTLGATLAFITSRYLLRKVIQERFSDRFESVQRGIRREGALYLFALRLVPLFPFFLVNLLMGLTPIRLSTFFWVSQVGMLPGTLAYVYAGTELANIQNIHDIVSSKLLFAFAILGILPLISSRIVSILRTRKMAQQWNAPKEFDFNMTVIGAGSAGLVSAYVAAATKAKVALIERAQMGGDCLNTGCVPSKALLKTARIVAQASRAKEFGLRSLCAEFEFDEIMQRVQRVIRRIEPHDSRERYEKLGVQCIQGDAEILDPYRVRVNGKVYSSKSLVVATGAMPTIPAIEGIERIQFVTSETLWELRELPKRLLVVGGGPVGCELAQCFARFGSEVTLLETASQILSKEDFEAAQVVRESLEADGVQVHLSTELNRFFIEDSEQIAVALGPDGEVRAQFDLALLAVGRTPRTSNLGLDRLGVQLRENGTIETDRYLRTAVPNIYACGDVTGPYQLTHAGAYQAWCASMNALFSPWKSFSANYRVIPRCTYTEPELAHVGITEREALSRNIDYEVTQYYLSELDRAICEEDTAGFVKVITPRKSGSILGVTIVGHGAGELISEFVLAMKKGMKLGSLLSIIHTYPTMAEANKFVAGEWRKNHVPTWVVKVAEKFHAWRRS